MQVLQVNMYYEKIYLFLWLWLFTLAIATLCSLVHWLWLLLPTTRNAFVLELLRDARLASHPYGHDPHPVNRDTALYVGDTFLGVRTIALKRSKSERFHSQHRKRDVSETPQTLSLSLSHVCFSAIVNYNVLLFLFSCAQMDGVFLLYLIERNSNRREAANVLNEIYKDFEKSKKRAARQQQRPPALPRNARGAPNIEDAEIGFVDAVVSKP